MVETKRSFQITGMTCASCSKINERALLNIPGVTFASINLATETAFVISDESVTVEMIKKAVERAGYGISFEKPENLEQKRYAKAKTNLILSLSLTIPLAILMLFHMTGHLPGKLGTAYFWFEIITCSIVIFYSGRQTIRGAWIALTHFHTNMDTLIFLGSLTAWTTSILHFLGMMHLIPIHILSFGAVGAMIVALHITGRFIESWLRDRAAREIKSLLKIQAKEARVLTDEGEIMVPIEAVKEGLLVLVKPGERIPVDGEVIEGISSVDESMISGEPIPVTKEIKANITGGSMNLTGVLKIKVSRVGEKSFLSQMIQLIQEAQGSKVPIQALADRITLWFVPTIIVLATTSFIFWYNQFYVMQPFITKTRIVFPWVLKTTDPLSFAIFAFVATMVIACPCALGLATPMALIAGTGLAAKRGVIVKNGEAIQTSKEISVILMDKTGTITKGCPEVVRHTIPLEELDVISSIESNSNHPLAKAIATLGKTNIPVTELKEITGEGMMASVGGIRYFIGKPDGTIDYASYYLKGQTVVEIKKNNTLLGFIVIEDPIREDSQTGIEQIKKMGIHPIMATGDNDTTARIVAKSVGIEEVYAGIKPEDKLNLIHKFRSEGKKVLMVGDGMNDAAALKGSDIGVAIGSGTDLAIDSADMIIVRGGISKITELVRISRKTFAVIRQNLFWAFVYNIIAIPLAMLGLLHPAIAELAMAFSSITVVINSLQIKKLKWED